MFNYFEAEEKCFERLKRSAEFIPEMPWESVLRVWTEGGLLTPDLSGDNLQSWSNVCVHSATTAIVAHEVARLLLSFGCSLSSYDATLATLLHDWNKKLEVEQIKSSRNVFAVSEFNQTSNLKIESSFGRRIASLSLFTGDLGYESFLRNSFCFEELIVFYSDACTSGARVVGYEERFESLKEHFQPGGRYEHTEQHFQNTYGKGWRECNLEVISELEGILASKGVPKSPELTCSLVPDWCLI
jgi:hypothetical protein